MRIAPIIPSSPRAPAAFDLRAPMSSIPTVPGAERPPVPPKHPALPLPVPGLQQLAQIASAARPEDAFQAGAHPSTIRNAHYTNTRAQLAYALSHAFNSVEGDVRLVGGVAIMQHDRGAPADLTFEQWAWLSQRAGKHLRIDLKEAAALPAVEAALRSLGIPSGQVTFNLAVGAPWASANHSVAAIKALRERFPESWVTLNLAMPLAPGYAIAMEAARRIGGDRLGVAVMAETARASDVRRLRTVFSAVNAWNVPALRELDIEATTRTLRAMGVNGMLDLRRRDDPLASN